MSESLEIAESPCVRNCCLDDADVCMGCFRSMEEIMQWGESDNHQRRIILKNAEQRRDAAKSGRY